MKTKNPPHFYQRVRDILESARTSVVRSVNTTQVVANWLIGREIIEEEQSGKSRAGYGKNLVEDLANKLCRDFGKGYSSLNLWLFRRFYLEYPKLISFKISHAMRKELDSYMGNLYALSKESWQPGFLNPNLSWTHYRTFLRVDRNDARAFYEIETLKNNWSSRELERQINSFLFERLIKSKDKKGLLKLANKGHEIQKPEDIFKDPIVIEFLGMPESPKLVESNIEQSLISNLQSFLLEMGRGFAFVARQQRLTLDGDHFYIDLVFYHTILKCYILIDLKVGKITHGDLGQLQLYVNYYDQERRTKGDSPTLGLILCADKNEAMVKYTLGPKNQKIFASRYKLNLPSEEELKAILQKDVKKIM